jgi:hypothetical protein
MSDEAVIFRDFSRKRRPIFFTIDEERFDCHKALGIAELQEAMSKFRSARDEKEDVTAENVLHKLSAAMSILLKPESHTRFMDALFDQTREEPIDMEQLTEIFHWLIEQYTRRPTQAVPDSSNSSQDGNAGTDSPDGAPLPASIL